MIKYNSLNIYNNNMSIDEIIYDYCDRNINLNCSDEKMELYAYLNQYQIFNDVDDYNIISRNPNGKFLIPNDKIEETLKLINIVADEVIIGECQNKEKSGMKFDFDILLKEKPDKKYDIRGIVNKLICVVLNEFNYDYKDELYTLLLRKPEIVYSNKYKCYKDGFHLIIPQLQTTKSNKYAIVDYINKSNDSPVIDIIKSVYGDNLNCDANKVLDKMVCSNPIMFVGCKSKLENPPYIIDKIIKIVGKGKKGIQINPKKFKNIAYEFSLNFDSNKIDKSKTYKVKDSIYKLYNIKNTNNNLNICIPNIKPFKQLKELLLILDYNRYEYNYWLKIAMSIINYSNGSDEGFKIFDVWCKDGDNYNYDNNLKIWNELVKKHKNNKNYGITIGTLKYYAKQDNPKSYKKIMDRYKYDNSPYKYFIDYKKLIDIKKIKASDLYLYINSVIVQIHRGGNDYLLSKNQKFILEENRVKEKITFYEYIKVNKLWGDKGCDKLYDVYCKNFDEYIIKFGIKNKKGNITNYDILEKGYDTDNEKTYGLSLRNVLEDSLIRSKIRSYNYSDFIPYYKNKPKLPYLFNTFDSFYLLNEITNIDIKFEETIIYNFLTEIICSNDKGLINHIFSWISHLIQKPYEKPEISLVLISSQGCGKNCFVDFITYLIGDNYSLEYEGGKNLLGKFNAEQYAKLFINVNEIKNESSLYNDNDKLKGIQTRKKAYIEKKGVDKFKVSCFERFCFTSNNENAMRVENSERRMTMLKLNEVNKQNNNYFSKVYNELNNINYMKIAFDYFGNYDISNFNCRKAYATEFKNKQKIKQLSPCIKFLIDFIIDDDFRRQYQIPLERCSKKYKIRIGRFHKMYVDWSINNIHKPYSRTLFKQKIEFILDKLPVKSKKTFVIFNLEDVENGMRKYLNYKDYKIIINNDIDENNDIYENDNK